MNRYGSLSRTRGTPPTPVSLPRVRPFYARRTDLEGYERDLRDQQEQVERLRHVWGGWAAALEADVPTAREILKKVLVGRILVRPVGRGAWTFAGISRYDGALRGGLGRVANVRPAYGPRYDDFCQLMLHLLAEPALAASRTGHRESLVGLCMERARLIAGGGAVRVAARSAWRPGRSAKSAPVMLEAPHGIRQSGAWPAAGAGAASLGP